MDLRIFRSREGWLQLGIFLLPIALGFLIGRSVPNTESFYQSLQLPTFAPPPGFFPVVWSILYVMLGIASLLLYRARAPRREVYTALLLFYLQLAVNYSWTPVFFGLQDIRLGFFLLLFLLLLAVATLRQFWRIRRAAFWWMLPYVCFLGFALLLNGSILRLNG